MAIMRFGAHPVLEAEANRILREDLAGVTKFSEKKDILTPWKEAFHHRREVYSHTGVAEPSRRQGIYGRAANPSRPDLNSRDGVTRAPRRGMSALEQFVQENTFNDGER